MMKAMEKEKVEESVVRSHFGGMDVVVWLFAGELVVDLSVFCVVVGRN